MGPCDVAARTCAAIKDNPACLLFLSMAIMFAGMIFLCAQTIIVEGGEYDFSDPSKWWDTPEPFTPEQEVEATKAANLDTYNTQEGLTWSEGMTTEEIQSNIDTLEDTHTTNTDNADLNARESERVNNNNCGMITGVTLTAFGGTAGLLTSFFASGAKAKKLQKAGYIFAFVLIAGLGLAFGTSFSGCAGGACTAVTATGIMGLGTVLFGVGVGLDTFTQLPAKAKTKIQAEVQTWRRRLTPAESILESMNGLHHRRLAPLESLLVQIEAATCKHASLHREIISW
jgi:hypothetical protein